MFGENAGVCGCVQVCVGVHRHVWVCSVVYGYAWVCMSLRVCASGVWVYMGICGYTRVCLDVPGCAWVHVCGMNFQNTYWRLESLHQRTLIRILYEFFIFALSLLF